LKFCFRHLLGVTAAASIDIKERRVAERAASGLFFDSLVSAQLSKRVYRFKNVNGTSPVGPLRCVAMISSAFPLRKEAQSLEAAQTLQKR
jgi:hypothetical protein